MKKFRMTVQRTGWGYKEFEVEAKSTKEAKETVLNMAGSSKFLERDSSYKILSIEEVKNKEGGDFK
jgi:ribosomal protein L20A (L18A)